MEKKRRGIPLNEEEKQQPKEKKQPEKPEEQKTKDSQSQSPAKSKKETTKPTPSQKPQDEKPEEPSQPTSEQPKPEEQPVPEQKDVESTPEPSEKPPEPTETAQQPKGQPSPIEEPSKEPEKTKTTEKSIPKPPEQPSTPEKQGKSKEEDEDFRYIVRIADTDINGEKRLIYGLSQIKGIGRHLAFLVTKQTGIKPNVKMGDLTDQQIDKIKDILSDIESIAPSWMLNHRKDMDTGKDIHLISAQVGLRLRDDINVLKMIRSYRGFRHELNLPVRGQRTRANNRKGLALGVSRRRE